MGRFFGCVIFAVGFMGLFRFEPGGWWFCLAAYNMAVGLCLMSPGLDKEARGA